MRSLLSVAGMILVSACAVVGQTRADLAARFGAPQSEIFLLPQNVKLTATYDARGVACAFRIETRDHSERVAPNLTDGRYWTDSALVTRLIVDLVPEDTRRGTIHSDVVGLRVGEHMRVESDDTVQITRIQRSRPLLVTRELPVADRLVKIEFKRAECQK